MVAPALPIPRAASGRSFPFRPDAALLIAWTVLLAVAAARSWPGFAADGFGPDPDDAMRYLQLRDFLGGQGWYDLDQHRLGAEGTAIHWSRLSDLPFLLVAWPLQFLLGAEGALRVAGAVVPPLLLGVWAWGTLRGVRALLPHTVPAPLLGVLLGVAGLPFAYRFAPGAFDHHGVQIALLGIAVGLSLVAEPSRRTGATVALALVASTVVGLETLPFAAAVAVAWALLWAWGGEHAGAVESFALTVVVGVAVSVLLFLPPGARTAAVCDAWGMPAALALSLGGGGLLALVRGSPGTTAGRIGGLLGLGILCGATLGLAAPECLADPMSALPETVRTDWLAEIGEARPALSPAVELPDAVGALGVQAVALLAALASLVWPGAAAAGRRRAWGLLAVLTALGLAATLHQIRFGAAGQALAVFVGVSLAARAVEAREWSMGPRRGKTLGPAVRMPMALVAVAAMSATVQSVAALVAVAEPTDVAGSTEPEGVAAACPSPDLFAALAGERDALVWASTDHAPELMIRTPVRPLAGNYHRGADGIAQWLELRDTGVGEVGTAMRRAGVGLVLLCPDGPAEEMAVERDPEGWVAALLDGGNVEGFVLSETVGGARLYRVAFGRVAE